MKTLLSGAAVAVCVAGLAAGTTGKRAMTLARTPCDTLVARAMANPTASDSLLLVRTCPGRFGPMMASLIVQFAPQTDTVASAVVFSLASGWREPEIYDSAEALASNAALPDMTRMWALKILTDYESPAGVAISVPMMHSLVGSTPGICNPEAFPDLAVKDGDAPLPSDHVARSAGVAASVLAGSASGRVKFMASCLKSVLEPPALDDSPPLAGPFSWDSVSVVHICEGHYKIRNANPVWTTVILYQFGWNEAQDGWREIKVSLPPKPANADYSEVSSDAGNPLYKFLEVLTPDYEELSWQHNGHPCDP